ncbi:MAG: hypothetical protein KAJ23_14415 [Maribacter sp.]|nr:hypothetical protein [Maribacter sp.]
MARIGMLIVLLFIAVGCSKDDSEDGFYNGSATALKNGEAWKAKAFFGESTDNPGKFLLTIDVHNNQGFWRESLGIQKINNVFVAQQVGHYLADSSFEGALVSYSTFIDDGDVLGDFYELDTIAADNHFQLTRYNSSKGEIEGVFNISYVLTRDDGEGEVPPARLEFKEGKFFAKAKRSWFE